MMTTMPGTRHHQHIYLKHKELSELYVSVFIKCIGDSLISIFTPIYLLSIGYSIPKVAIFNIIAYASVSFFLPLGIWLDQKLGIKKTLSLGTFCLMAYYLLLIRLKSGFPFVSVAIIWGLSVALYYAAYNVELTKTLQRNQEARGLSVMQILSVVAGILGPITGALVIHQASYATLFICVAVFYVVSILPLSK
jgi:predicted MFS family arabinose efflux permease